MKVGTLEIEFMANVAKLARDVEQAKGMLAGVERAASLVKGALGGIAAGLSVGMFANWIKEAIAAADAAGKLAQQAGVAVKDVAGLQLAFELSGQQAGDMTRSMAYLSRAMVDGSRALAQMGIASRGADGQLRATTDVLADVADVFQALPAGAQESALAVKLFGESGTKMLPMLNAGSAGLADMQEMAERLGLVLDENTTRQAEQFNDTLDLVARGGRGIATQLAAQLLPTLTTLAGEFLTAMTSGDRLRKTADVLAGVLRGLYSVALGVVEVFSSVGTVLGGVVAAVIAAMRGDFREAWDILGMMKRDVVAGWADTAGAIARAWDSSGDATIEAQAAVLKSTRLLTTETAKTGSAAKKAAHEHKAMADAIKRQYDDIMAGIEADELLRRKELERLSVHDDLLASYEERATAAERELELYGLTALQVEELTLAQLREARAIAALNGALPEHLEFYEQLIAKQQRLVTAMRATSAAKEQAPEAAREIALEYVRVYESLETALSDALIDGTASGLDDAGELIQRWLKAMTAQMVIRPLIQPIFAEAAGMMGVDMTQAGGSWAQQAFGMNQSSASSMFGTAANPSMLGNITSTALGAIGSMGGFGAGMASMGSQMMLGSSFVGPSASLAGGAVGAGASFMAAIPYIGAIIAIASMLMKPGGGPKSEFYGGDRGMFDGDSIAERAPQNAGMDAVAEATKASYFQALKDLGVEAGGNVRLSIFGDTDPQGTAKDRAAFAVDIDGERRVQQFKFGRGDMGEEELSLVASRALLAALEASDLGDTINTYLDGLDIGSMSQEQIDSALMTVKAFDSLSDAFTDLGMDADAMTQSVARLADASGNVDAFVQAQATIWESLSTDPFEAYAEAAEASSRTLMGTWAMQGDVIDELVSSYDGSLAATQTLAAATAQRYQTEIQLAQQFAQAMQGTSAMFESSIRQVKLDGMNTQEKYSFFDDEAAKYRDLLASVTDPQLIASYSEKLNESIVSAWNLLSEDQKRAKSDEFQELLEDAKDLSQDQYEKGQDLMKAEREAQAGRIEQAIKDAWASVATDISSAVPKQIDINVNVDTPASVELTSVN